MCFVAVVLGREIVTEMLPLNLPKSWYRGSTFHSATCSWFSFSVISTKVSLFLFLFDMKVERRLDLVYGGGSIGLMGLVSQAVHQGGGNVLGYNH